MKHGSAWQSDESCAGGRCPGRGALRRSERSNDSGAAVSASPTRGLNGDRTAPRPKRVTARLIALDWGTSNLRAYLLGDNGAALESLNAPRGAGRLASPREFAATFEQLLAPWLAAHAHVPVIISGMAGSAEGWIDAGYVECPADAVQLGAALAPLRHFGQRKVVLVPGIRGHSPAGQAEVMRGEETQLTGAMRLAGHGNGLWCLPGTHSKWARTHCGRVTGFSTFLTGDAFEALRHHTILERTAAGEATHLAAFDQGVERSRHGDGLLHQLFGVRAAVLSGQVAREAGASYLSGLLIGSEIGAATKAYPGDEAVRLVASPALAPFYARACRRFGKASQILDAEQATVGGLWRLAILGNLLAAETVR